MPSGKQDQARSEEVDAQLRAYGEQLMQADMLLRGANKAIAQYYKARGYPDFDFQHPAPRFDSEPALRPYLQQRVGR